MRKFLTILLAAILCLSCVAMIGCGVEGKYELIAVEVDGEVYEEGDKFKIDGEKISYNDFYDIVEVSNAETITFKEEGVVKFAGVKGKWKESKGVVTVTFNGVKTKFDKKGKKLRLDFSKMAGFNDDVVLIYKKV